MAAQDSNVNWSALNTSQQPTAQPSVNWSALGQSVNRDNPAGNLVGQSDAQGSHESMSALDAFMRSGGYGMDQYATTLLKAGAKTGLFPGLDPESVQGTFNQNYVNAGIPQAQQEHPIASGLGQAVGNTIATLPLMALPGVSAGAGVSTLAGLGKLALSGANMAGQGALMSGLATQPGQDPNTVINVPNAVSGGIIGGVLGSTLAPMAANYAAKTANYLESKIPGVPQLSTDINKEGWVNQAEQWVVNSVLSKFPGISGTSTFRDAQLAGIQKQLGTTIAGAAQGQYINGLIKNTEGKGITALGNLLEKHSKELDQHEDQLWNAAKQQMSQAGIDSIPITPFADSDLLNSPGVSDLTKKQLMFIQMGPEELLTPSLSPQQLIDMKGTIWKNYATLAKRINTGNADPDEVDTANTLRNGYWSLVGDLQNAVKGTDAEPALNTATGFTRMSKSLFDPAQRKELVNAIDDARDQYGQTTKFFNWLTKRATPQEQQDVGKVLGNTGQQQVQKMVTGQKLSDIYNQNMKNVGSKPVFNISGFLDDLAKNKDTGPYFKPENISKLKDFENVMQDYMKARPASTATSTEDAVSKGAKEAGAIGGAITGGITGLGMIGAHAGTLPAIATGGAVLATPAVLSAVVKYSPLKNLAGWVGQGLSSDTKGFLLNRFGDILGRAGISVTQDKSGNTIATHADDQKPLKKLSMLTPQEPDPYHSDLLQPHDISHEDIVKQLDKGHDDYSQIKMKQNSLLS